MVREARLLEVSVEQAVRLIQEVLVEQVVQLMEGQVERVALLMEV